jgi:hypothetical protein
MCGFFFFGKKKHTKIVKKTKQVNPIGYGDLFYFHSKKKRKKKVDDL